MRSVLLAEHVWGPGSIMGSMMEGSTPVSCWVLLVVLEMGCRLPTWSSSGGIKSFLPSPQCLYSRNRAAVVRLEVVVYV